MSINDNYDVIAVPHSKNYSGGGTIEILFYYDENGFIKPIDPKVFPSGKCWVINDYEDFIDKNYKPDELFRINDLNKTNYLHEDAKSPGNYVEWCCTSGSKSKKIDHDLFRVIDCPLPNVDTGELSWLDDDLQRGIYFISDKNKVYGPFEITIDLNENNKRYIASPYNTPSLPIPAHHIICCAIDKLSDVGLLNSVDISNEKRMYVGSLKQITSLMRDSWDIVDFISAPQLLKFISTLKNRNSNSKLMSNSVLSQVRVGVESFLKERGERLGDQQRFKRAIEILEASESHGNTWMEALDTYVNTEPGIISLKKHAIEKYVKADNELLKIKKNELSQIESEVIARKDLLQQLNVSITESENKLSRTRDVVEKEIREQNKVLQKEKESLEKNIDESKRKLFTLEEKYSSFDTLDKVTAEITGLDRDKSRLDNTVDHLKGILQNPKLLIEKMTEVHSVMDILGYSQRTPVIEKNVIINESKKQSVHLEPNLQNALNFIHTITSRLNEMDSRELSEVETANLLICMQQNLLTILQGRPGVGKTSTAINLATALGIHDKKDNGHNADFLNIPVARGWTGSRDLIGFYNGLRGVFQPAKTGLYQFLLNGEKNCELSNSRIVLLDEANLSPIEHYWSDFIGLTDKEGASRAIDTGASGEERFLHPTKYNSLRFIATINNDSTTEPISSRLLNRSPVICMDTIDVGLDGHLGGTKIEIDGAVSAIMLEAFFGRNTQIISDPAGSDLYEGVKKVTEAGIEKSPSLKDCLVMEGRKLQSILSYLNVAGELMVDNKDQAQDFALSQFILPHLKGEGESVRQAIKAMIAQARSNDLKRSVQLMERILSDGDNYLQSYSFL